MRDTAQIRQWTGTFGNEYTERNLLTPDAHDELYARDFGIGRKRLNQLFLRQVPEGARILEVGCNIANQLVLLQQMGYSNLFGMEIQAHALQLARSRTRNIFLVRASAFDIPFPDKFFDLVFTSRVLIHMSPEDLPRVLDEIYRVTRNWVWGTEYYSPQFTEVNYRGRELLLWKADYPRIYLDRFRSLELVREQHLPYLQSENVDCMFLLRKIDEHG